MGEVIQFPRDKWVNRLDKSMELPNCECDDCLDRLQKLMMNLGMYDDAEDHYAQFPPIDDPTS